MTRQRYCNIKVHSLNDILETCERHIHNASLMHFDLIDNGDMTPTDVHYIKMFRETWSDLRDDVQQMLKGI